MRKGGRPTHFLGVLDHESTETEENHPVFRILDDPQDFVVVGRKGDPDFEKDPLAATVAIVSELGVTRTETWASKPVKESMAGLTLLHSRLVAPMQQFLAGDSAAGVHSTVEMSAAGLIMRGSLISSKRNTDVVAAHMVYPGRSGRGVAGSLVVARQLANTNQVVGGVGEYNRWQEVDIDLTGLINREQHGDSTSLRVDHAIEARALGAIGLLADQVTLEKAAKGYTPSSTAPVVDAGTTLHQE